MDFTDTARTMNIILALMSVPPALSMTIMLIRERKVIETSQKVLNDLLTFLYGGISAGAILNAAISILSAVGYGNHAHEFSLARSVYISAFFALITWGTYFYKSKIKR